MADSPSVYAFAAWVGCFRFEVFILSDIKQKGLLLEQRFGRWTVLDDYVLTSQNERKWLCRCDCGTERYVLERSLKSGGSKSCGCLRKEQAEKANAMADMEGKTFGELTVLHRAERQRKNGGIWWTCRCSCGNLYDVPASLLITGRRTRCSCNVHEKNYAFSDITGQRFHRLVALYPLKERGKKSVIWHCRCDCGNEVDVPYNNLLYTNMKSCGCQKKEHDEKLGSFLTHIAGTSLDMLKSQKTPTNNTSGVKGVYWIRGKWVAKIVFQKKQYSLGAYENFDDAVRARKDAEESIYKGTIEHYTRWKAIADTAPQWAKDNPISIFVERTQDNTISVIFLPTLQEMEGLHSEHID